MPPAAKSSAAASTAVTQPTNTQPVRRVFLQNSFLYGSCEISVESMIWRDWNLKLKCGQNSLEVTNLEKNQSDHKLQGQILNSDPARSYSKIFTKYQIFHDFPLLCHKITFPHEQFHPLSASSPVSIFFVGCCAQQSLLDPDILLFYVFQ